MSSQPDQEMEFKWEKRLSANEFKAQLNDLRAIESVRNGLSARSEE